MTADHTLDVGEFVSTRSIFYSSNCSSEPRAR